MSEIWKKVAVLAAVLALLVGLLHALPFHHSPLPTTCIQVDAQDEAAALDYDGHNCAGVR